MPGWKTSVVLADLLLEGFDALQVDFVDLLELLTALADRVGQLADL